MSKNYMFHESFDPANYTSDFDAEDQIWTIRTTRQFDESCGESMGFSIVLSNASYLLLMRCLQRGTELKVYSGGNPFITLDKYETGLLEILIDSIETVYIGFIEFKMPEWSESYLDKIHMERLLYLLTELYDETAEGLSPITVKELSSEERLREIFDNLMRAFPLLAESKDDLYKIIADVANREESEYNGKK